MKCPRSKRIHLLVSCDQAGLFYKIKRTQEKLVLARKSPQINRFRLKALLSQRSSSPHTRSIFPAGQRSQRRGGRERSPHSD